jgi:ATP-dependent Clp protease ATP-binding subunit ClpB
MMDMNQWTQKAQEALKKAQSEAIRRTHQQVDAEHLLFALVTMPEGLVASLLQRIGVSIPGLTAKIEEALSKRPAVSGDVEQGKIMSPRSLTRCW